MQLPKLKSGGLLAELEPEQSKRLPTVFIPGAQKSATTSLAAILATHPDLFLGLKKEPHFYSIHSKFASRIDEYCGYYSQVGKAARILIDASQSYMPFAEVPERISQTVGATARFIFIFRDPVDRAISAFGHFRALPGGETHRRIADLIPHNIDQMDLSSLLEFERRQIAKCMSEGRIIARNADWGLFPFTYFDVSAYSKHVRRYLDFFPRQNFLFLKFDDFVADQLETMGRIAAFLSIDPSKFSLEERVHANELRIYSFPWFSRCEGLQSRIKRYCPNAVAQWLRRFKRSVIYRKPNHHLSAYHDHCLRRIFAHDIRQLAEITNLTLDNWLLKQT